MSVAVFVFFLAFSGCGSNLHFYIFVPILSSYPKYNLTLNFEAQNPFLAGPLKRTHNKNRPRNYGIVLEKCPHKCSHTRCIDTHTHTHMLVAAPPPTCTCLYFASSTLLFACESVLRQICSQTAVWTEETEGGCDVDVVEWSKAGEPENPSYPQTLLPKSAQLPPFVF